jgi:hypothetical protein
MNSNDLKQLSVHFSQFLKERKRLSCFDMYFMRCFQQITGKFPLD